MTEPTGTGETRLRRAFTLIGDEAGRPDPAASGHTAPVSARPLARAVACPGGTRRSGGRLHRRHRRDRDGHRRRRLRNRSRHHRPRTDVPAGSHLRDRRSRRRPHRGAPRRPRPDTAHRVRGPVVQTQHRPCRGTVRPRRPRGRGPRRGIRRRGPPHGPATETSRPSRPTAGRVRSPRRRGGMPALCGPGRPARRRRPGGAGSVRSTPCP